MPTMLLGIVRDLLSAEPDFIVVGCSRPDEDPLARARDDRADMLITEDRGASGTSGLDAVVVGPPLCIFAIAPDGRKAAAVDLVRRVVDLDTSGQGAFADAIRSAVGLPC